MKKRLVLAFILMLFIIPFFGLPSNAQTVVNDYAPVFYFESEETCFPVNANYHIQNSFFYDNSGQLISSSPTGGIIATYSDSELYDLYYLDNTIGSINNDNIINNYLTNENSLGYTVYYHEAYDYATSSTVIQYWMFYAFNKGHLNQHEGDWEMVEVVIPNNGEKWVAYSQHYSGQMATWDQVEKDGNHIKVYVARGSHANFLRSFSGKVGVANDFVGSNGKVLRPSDYTLLSVDEEDWLNFAGRWGELGDDFIESTAKSVLGQAGPRGPRYRLEGEMWNNPVGWGSSLPPASDTLFLLDWFIYNFITIFIILTILLFALTVFLIYKKHKKYGLGPRYISILYIDGFNIKTIGNILCIIGIVLVIIGLVLPWYQISYDTSALEISEEFQTFGMAELMKIDGISGIQIIVPGQNGFSPLGTISIPFSVFLAVGLIFLILSTIGIAHSKKLGSKYIWRGIRLIIPIILILIAIIALGSIISSKVTGSNEARDSVVNILNSVSGSPFGSQETFNIDIGDGLYAPLDMSWGLSSGGWLLLIGPIIIIIAGILELIAKTQFFKIKIPLLEQARSKVAYPPPVVSVRQSSIPQSPVQQKIPQPPRSGTSQPEQPMKKIPKFCLNCGAPLVEKASFCAKCGKKLL